MTERRALAPAGYLMSVKFTTSLTIVYVPSGSDLSFKLKLTVSCWGNQSY